MPVLLTLIIGSLAGLIAVKFMELEVSWPVAVSIGVVGAVVGGIGLRLLMGLLSTAGSVLAILIGAILGAILLIWIYQTYFGSK